MSLYSIEELRRVQKFIHWDEWPLQGSDTNCIAYALGLPLSDPRKKFFSSLVSSEQGLIRVMTDLGLSFRKISNPKDKANQEVVIVLYDYYYPEIHRERDYEGIVHTWKTGKRCHETHLARIELDGTWTHKFGWDYETSVTSSREIHDVILRDDQVDVHPSAFYAVQVC